MARCRFQVLSQGSSVSAWEARPSGNNLPPHLPFLARCLTFCRLLPITPRLLVPTPWSTCGLMLGDKLTRPPPERVAAVTVFPARHRMVGRCQHFIWNWYSSWLVLGSVALGARGLSGPTPVPRYWLGRGSSCGTWSAHCDTARFVGYATVGLFTHPGLLRQQWSRHCGQQGPLAQQSHKRGPARNLCSRSMRASRLSPSTSAAKTTYPMPYHVETSQLSSQVFQQPLPRLPVHCHHTSTTGYNLGHDSLHGSVNTRHRFAAIARACR